MDDSDVIILCGIVIELAIVVAFLLLMKKKKEDPISCKKH